LEEVKRYYIEEERYDWVEVAERFRGIESLFLRNRRRLISKALRKFSRGSPTLDAGCGTGLILMRLPEAVGVDINPWAVGKALTRCTQRQHLIVGDLEYLPLRNRVFRTVVCTEVIEHLPNPLRALEEIWRVMRPNGVMVGSVPHRSILRRLYEKLKFRGLLGKALSTLTSCPRGEPFHHHYTMDEVGRMLGKFFKMVSLWIPFLRLNVMFVCEKASTKPSPYS